MSIAFLLPFLLLAGPTASPPADQIAGEEGEEKDSDWMVPKSFVILKSTVRYREARAFAESSAKQLGVKLDLRGLAPTRKTGLTYSRNVCLEEVGEFPCYWPRGRFDDGVYISVEHSSGYEGLKEGLYIVVLANGSPEDADLRKAFRTAKTWYGDAYIQNIPIYLGCVH